MLRRRTPRPAPRRDSPGAPMGYHTETIVVADPDVANLKRSRALRYQIGRGLEGQSGLIVGHQNGAPEVSFTGYATGVQHAPTDALNSVMHVADAQRLSAGREYADALGSNVDDDPYMSLAWSRVARQ